jgi:hypothetical protein
MNIDVSNRAILLSQRDYAKRLPVNPISGDTAVPDSPLPRNIHSDGADTSQALPSERVTDYRSLLGSLAFLQHTRIDLNYAISFFGRASSKPTEYMMRLLLRCAWYAKCTADTCIPFYVRHVDTYVITAYCDASFGSKDYAHAQTGYVICVNGSPVIWKSSIQRRVAASTVKAELSALYDCVDVLILLIYFYSQLRVSVSVDLFCDSFNLVQLIKAAHPKPAEKHLLIELRRIQELLDGPKGNRIPRLRNRDCEKRLEKELDACVLQTMAVRDMLTYLPDYMIRLHHIDGVSNPADCLTKSVDVGNLVRTMLLRS